MSSRRGAGRRCAGAAARLAPGQLRCPGVTNIDISHENLTFVLVTGTGTTGMSNRAESVDCRALEVNMKTKIPAKRHLRFEPNLLHVFFGPMRTHYIRLFQNLRGGLGATLHNTPPKVWSFQKIAKNHKKILDKFWKVQSLGKMLLFQRRGGFVVIQGPPLAWGAPQNGVFQKMGFFNTTFFLCFRFGFWSRQSIPLGKTHLMVPKCPPKSYPK